MGRGDLRERRSLGAKLGVGRRSWGPLRVKWAAGGWGGVVWKTLRDKVGLE